MGGGGTPSQMDVIGIQHDERPGMTPKCSSTVHIAKKQYVSYAFPSVNHLGIISTKILPSAEHLLNSW